MLTNRFIKISTALYDTKQADIIGYNGDSKTDDTVIYVSPFEISHFRPGFDDNDEMNYTLIYLKNGYSFHGSLTIEEFLKLLDAF